MEKNLILWGVKKGEKYESLITEQDNMENIGRAAEWAKANGWKALRFMVYHGEAPDFVGTVAKLGRSK